MDKNLIVQLQEVANDSYLKVFGQLVLGKNQTSDTQDAERWFIFIADGPVMVKNLDNITMTSRYDERTGTELSFESGRHSILLTEDAQRVLIESKYNITEIRLAFTLFFEDISETAYMPAAIYNEHWGGVSIYNKGNLNKLESLADGSIDWKGSATQGNSTVLSFGSEVTGDIVNLNKFSLGNKVSVRLRDSDVYGNLSVFASYNDSFKANMYQIATGIKNRGNIYGNIEAFSDYTGLGMFSLLGSIDIYGSFVTALSNAKNMVEIYVETTTESEELAPLFDAWYNAGRTSGTCMISIPNKTVNGTVITNGTVTFSSNGWTFNASN